MDKLALDKIQRLSEIFENGLRNQSGSISSEKIEIETICRELIETYEEMHLKSKKDSPSVEYFDGKLFRMRRAALASIGIDRYSNTDQKLQNDFEDAKHLVLGLLRDFT